MTRKGFWLIIVLLLVSCGSPAEQGVPDDNELSEEEAGDSLGEISISGITETGFNAQGVSIIFTIS
ncbi:MAG: hypothetical protein ACRCYY_06560 [Trueperaceae bacterium]